MAVSTRTHSCLTSTTTMEAKRLGSINNRWSLCQTWLSGWGGESPIVTITIPALEQSMPEVIPGVTASLRKVVKLEDGYLFYVHMDVLAANPEFRVIEPGSISVVDSSGRKISLDLSGSQAFIADDQNLWEFGTKEEIAAGPVKLVIEKVKAHYNAWDWNVPPSPELVAAHSFTFNAVRIRNSTKRGI